MAVLAMRERPGPGAVGGCRRRAADLARTGVSPGDVAVLVPAVSREGQAVAVALEERAVPHRVRRGGGVLPARRDPRSPGLAAIAGRRLRTPAAVVASSRGRRSSCGRSTSPGASRSRGGASSTWSPRSPPPPSRRRCRPRRASGSWCCSSSTAPAMGAIDTTRPDLYVHRLIDRLGLRRHQLFAAQADVVERLRALARFGELASAYARRSPQATPREFARSIAAVADSGAARAGRARASRARARSDRLARGRLPRSRPSTCTSSACTAAIARPAPGADSRRARCSRRSPPSRTSAAAGAAPRALRGDHPRRDAGGAVLPERQRPRRRAPASAGRSRRRARRVGGEWEDKPEELFGPAETLHSTYRLLRDELLEGTMRSRRRGSASSASTPTSTSPHAVVRYLELLKLAALIERPEDQSLAEAMQRRQRPDPPGGHRRAARDPQLLGARRLPARRRARRAAAHAGDRRARRALAGAVPAQARRRGACCRPRTSTPTAPVR